MSPPRRILVVEDDGLVRELATELLTDAGSDVASVPDADAALRALEASTPPALLFTDIVMPGRVDGVAPAREAKRRLPELRVVYTTGYASRFAREGAEELYGPLIAKPHSPDQLRAEIAKALAKR
jgi:CheY-like chemotaxis protein